MSLRAFKKAIIVYGKHNIFFVMGRCCYASKKLKGPKVRWTILDGYLVCKSRIHTAKNNQVKDGAY